jgi:3-oxoacyl-[acyl-carrier protein] reductase
VHNYSDLEGKTVLVTGTSKGIGKSIAELFLENGCLVHALYRNNPPKFNESILQDVKDITYLNADISDIKKIQSWLTKIESKGETVDILINNAAVYENKKLSDTDEGSWDRIMDTNLKSTFFLSQMIAKHMIGNESGTIINAASFASKISSLNYGVYAASKAALVSLTKTMAAEYAPYGIRVNAYSPGVIETDMTRDSIENNSKQMIESISLNRFGTAAEVARAVLFLASEQSSYINGTVLNIDGGKFIVQNPSIAWRE